MGSGSGLPAITTRPAKDRSQKSVIGNQKSADHGFEGSKLTLIHGLVITDD